MKKWNKFKGRAIGKIPAWIMAYCLEHLSSSGKKYSLNCCAVLDLGKTEDGAYLSIVGNLNKEDMLS